MVYRRIGCIIGLSYLYIIAWTIGINHVLIDYYPLLKLFAIAMSSGVESGSSGKALGNRLSSGTLVPF